jgi:hypothetical protein
MKQKSQGHYAVGYGKPPISGQIKKGEKRNPYGRRGTKNLHRSYIDIARRVLNEKIKIKEGDRVLRVPRLEAVMRSMTASALKGNLRAQEFVLERGWQVRFDKNVHHITNVHFVESDGNGRPKTYPARPIDTTKTS